MSGPGKMKIAVAMSGGVDSSVTAAMLQKAGHEVFGITMQVLDDERRQHIDDAAAVAGHLGIPHHTVNLVEPFRKAVKDYFAAEYRSGRTPNPCARCNPLIKFGLLLDLALELGADFLATGHYARVEHPEAGASRLLKGIDPRKDQSYFLFALGSEQLARVMFPLGGLTKDRVRTMAAEFGLPVKDKGESQEICFIPDDDYVRFLEAECGLSAREGAVIDGSGRVLGRHHGIHRYTVGQRRGLGIAYSEPLYVLGVDAARNEVIAGIEGDLYCNGLLASGFNWLCTPALPLQAACKIRYRHQPAACAVTDAGNGMIAVSFSQPQKSVTPGQAVVLYDNDLVLGGGWIEKGVKGEL
ncbi:tRNA-specific 2-thiouridylase MnmA [Geobacter sp. OR-1]|uniref:tRNA 2-thiouridine(34) synthase MnmA n=1 Tax=Geobacter sp. OR-1 TaxID=1266765 RepID=UPI0005443875|nr:tRNA 2-thiouridine(34) synthase MnmA [Geobacter sp. OR-1]GAM07975.1 tRNA-specific 2-thiouridylase MnmA [Geobacter sp. OR-1]